MGDESSLCDDPAARTDTVEPWWAPGTSVTTIGRAGSGVREHDGTDCGRVEVSPYGVRFPDRPETPFCSCGPNLIHCTPIHVAPGLGDGRNLDLDGSLEWQRRQVFEEPARLFAHIVVNDRPLSDLVLGDYTVVTRDLQHMYVRLARQNSVNRALDDDPWWREVTDGAAWRAVRFSQMFPTLLDDRHYAHDPRATTEPPRGVPSAGVMTTLGQLAAFPRERVRAARWLEILGCRNFVPPPVNVEFPPYRRDPGTEGVCAHCHQLIDPVAIHFKRFGWDGTNAQLYVGGIGDHRWDALCETCDPRSRWQSAYVHDTWMTPVSEADLAENPDARFIDFLPEGRRLFGQASDGTIGPLGFGRMLVESGEFDRCAVRRLSERFAGRILEPGRDDARIDALVARFVAAGRVVRPFLRGLLGDDSFREGF
jgi:hypothetical protein